MQNSTIFEKILVIGETAELAQMTRCKWRVNSKDIQAHSSKPMPAKNMQQDENQEDDKIAIPLLVLGSRSEEYVMKALKTKDQISSYVWKHKNLK